MGGTTWKASRLASYRLLSAFPDGIRSLVSEALPDPAGFHKDEVCNGEKTGWVMTL